MLARKKRMPENLKTRTTSTIAVTYDIANSSTKLILLNFSKKNESRHQTQEGFKGTSFLPKSLKGCQCLTESAPACACHQRDKSIPPYAKRNKAQHAETKPTKSDIRSQSAKTTEKLNDQDKLPPCSSRNKASAKTSKKSRGLSSHPVDRNRAPYNRDLDVLYSMPSLHHPDFTVGQRRVLMSLARIYMNITPTVRLSDEFVRRENKCRGQSKPKTESKDKRFKNLKNSTNKKKDNFLRRDSLQTAVTQFADENDEGSYGEREDIPYVDKNDDGNSLLDSSSRDLNDWIMDIIQDQVVSVSQETRYKNSSEVHDEGPVTTEYVADAEETEEVEETSDKNVETTVSIDQEGIQTEGDSEMKEVVNVQTDKDNEYGCEETVSRQIYHRNEGMQERDDDPTCIRNDEVLEKEYTAMDDSGHEEVDDERFEEKEIENIGEYLVEENISERIESDEEPTKIAVAEEVMITTSPDIQADDPSVAGTSEDIADNFNLLRYISDELRQMMVEQRS